MKKDFYLCQTESRTDTDRTEKVARILQEAGFTVEVGQVIQKGALEERMKRGLQWAERIIVIFSDEFLRAHGDAHQIWGQVFSQEAPFTGTHALIPLKFVHSQDLITGFLDDILHRGGSLS